MVSAVERFHCSKSTNKNRVMESSRISHWVNFLFLPNLSKTDLTLIVDFSYLCITHLFYIKMEKMPSVITPFSCIYNI